MNPAQFWGGGGAASYQIEQSLRVNRADGANMTRTFNDGGSSHTQWTFSFWTKRHVNSGGDEVIFYTHKGSGYSRLDIGSGGGIGVSLLQWAGSSWDYGIFTKPRLLDPSAWYHIVFVYDSPNGTPSERLRVYINGERQEVNTTFNESYPSQNFASELGKDVQHWLFRGVNYGTSYYNGYAAETYFIDNQALDPEDFGELDDNGVWRPIEYTGTYGGNSFYLKYASSGIGDDSSGEGNNWTPSAGFTTSGTGTDVMSDTPTTNWSTLNPLWNPIDATYAEGNLKFTGGSTHSPSASSISASSGKFYFEATALSGSAAKWSLGIIDTDIPYRKQPSAINYIPGYTPNNVYSEGDAISLYDNNIYKNGSIVVSSPFSGGAVAAGNVVQMAVDIDAGKIWFGINGTWNNGGGTEGAFNPSGHDTIFTANKDYIFHFTAESCGWEVNFGQRAFAYTPPTGFNALNTSNLPAPDIADGSQYFDTALWTNTTDVSSLSFQPDLVWVKGRSYTSDQCLTDAVRGVDAILCSSDTGAESLRNASWRSSYGQISSFDPDGFTISTGSSPTLSAFNRTNNTQVAWNWLGANGTSTPSGGSIASTVSVNPSAGFSIVSYTGTGTAGTVAHGLGNAPKMMIVKNRDSAEQWHVYHESIGNGYVVWLNSSAAQYGSYSDFWNSTSPTSTVFTVGTANGTNKSGDDLIAYCFAEVEGYSKFGSYTGNGSTDGPFVYCGFKPAWVMIKRTSSTGSWYIGDNTRNTYNVMNARLLANSSNAESSTLAFWDFTSNGFKLRTNSSEYNSSGQTFVFMAFASSPFGGSGVSPATAR